jgi:predicted lactoylglutathione lyase
MERTIIISLPVTDLNASKVFYTAIGFANNPQCTDDSCAFMTWSESISVMLLTHEKWRTFTSRPIPPKTSCGFGITLSCDSRTHVDAMNMSAAANGGSADVNPVEDYAFMYGRDFADPDGHVFGAKWMNLSAMPSRQQRSA